jgi:hypothetical protein
MAEALPPVQRAVALRRLGDLSLFLGGVFPDHVGRERLAPRDLERVVRAIESSGAPVGAAPLAAAAFAEGGVTVLDWVARMSYRGAGEREVPPDVVDHVVEARRFLNVLTDRYLFPLRERWFPLG